MSLIIRHATIEDMAQIHHLVMNLAIFEKAENKVKTTVDSYKHDFNQGIFESTVAVVNNDIVGATVYYETFSTWVGKMLYLEDFIVLDSYRNQGIGQKLFDSFIQTAKDKDCKMVKWQVLDWNVHAIRFYKRNGATIEDEWYNGKIIF